MGKREGSGSSDEDREKKKLKKEKKENGKDKKKHKDDKEDKEDKKDKKKEQKDSKSPKKDGKEEKKEKAEKEGKDGFLAKMGMKEVSLSAETPFNDANRPFGMELDGALVVDLAVGGDEDSAAMSAGVQIGWRVSTVAGHKVPEEEEGAAAKQLRSAEMDAAKRDESVKVCFVTEG